MFDVRGGVNRRDVIYSIVHLHLYAHAKQKQCLLLPTVYREVFKGIKFHCFSWIGVKREKFYLEFFF